MSNPPLPGFKLASRRTGEWHGPCPFIHNGDDRFHIWDGKAWWWCRKECPGCPGKPSSSGGRWGWLDQLGIDVSGREPAPPPPPPPSMTEVYQDAARLDDEVLAYLSWRGINPETARRFMIGRAEHTPRLTIPNVVVNSPPTCVGIKMRYLWEPPEGVLTYVSVPGTRGLSIFNFNRLKSRRWPYLVIVEAPLDAMLLDQLGIPAVAPFGGGGVWDRAWTKYFQRVKDVIIVADHDPPDVDKATGEVLSDEPGMDKARYKQQCLGRGILTYPPAGKDTGEAYLHGINLHEWIRYLLRDEKNEA